MSDTGKKLLVGKVERVLRPCKECDGWTAQIKVGSRNMDGKHTPVHYVCDGHQKEEYAKADMGVAYER